MNKFLPYGFGAALVQSSGNWEDGNYTMLGLYPECGVMFDPKEFLAKVLNAKYSFLHVTVAEKNVTSSTTLLFVTVWFDFSSLNVLFNEKHKDFLLSVFSWMSDDWLVLKKENALDELCRLCQLKYDFCNQEVQQDQNYNRNSLISILDEVPKPVLVRPWDLNNSDSVDSRIFDLPLPYDMLGEICSFLDAHSLFNLSWCNTYLRDCTLPVIPGLQLRLYPHQLTSVWWMLQQENCYSKSLSCSKYRNSEFQVWNSRTILPCPSVDWYQLENRLGCHNTLSSELPDYSGDFTNESNGILINFPRRSITPLFPSNAFGNPPIDGKSQCSSTRGGMLCDEPGLGKTVTILAVIMKTLGSVSRKPGKSSVDSTSAISLRRSLTVSRSRSVNPEYLVTSGATLVIIPDVLMDHWKLQINSHVNPRIMKNVYFDDDLRNPLPSCDFLSRCDLVVTTFKRLSVEWQHGKPLCSLDVRKPKSYADEFQGARWNEEPRVVSPLLGVYWLRVVVDEGHSLGKSSVTNILQMACALECDRRWILMGTPTQSVTDIVSSSLLRHISNILKFLRHNPFGLDNGELLWKQNVTRPLENLLSCDTTGVNDKPRILLIQVLSQIMIRHSKDSLSDIPKPTWSETKLTMNEQEKTSYNAVVALAKSNLVVTGKDYRNPGPKHLDSLLNPSNRKFLFQTLSNIRVAACGGGHTQLKLNPFEKCRDACLQLLRDIHSSSIDPSEDESQYRLKEEKISTFLVNVTQGIPSCCEHCDIRLPLLLITPCCHLYCPDCVNDMGEYCRLCQRSFSWDVFQKLQPGFEASDYLFGEGAIDTVVAANPSADISVAQPPSSIPWSETEIFQMDHDISTKGRYLISRIKELDSQYLSSSNICNATNSCFLQKRCVIPKIIVFSQFSEFLDKMTIDFTAMNIKYAYFKGKDKANAIKKFKTISDIRVLFLTKEGSHGLDLSFATHIFLMDCILDESVLLQVVSRAYRMGSKQSVAIDQIMMKDTIEETIFESRKLNMRSLQAQMDSKINAYSSRSGCSSTMSVGDIGKDISCEGCLDDDKERLPQLSSARARNGKKIKKTKAKTGGASKSLSSNGAEHKFSIQQFLITNLSLLKNGA